MTAAVELKSVSKHYGRVEAVKELSLVVPEGSLFGLIGPNGAGKTTTFGLLSGFIRPTAGEVFVRGRPLSPERPPVGQVLALPQDAHLPERHRVRACLVHLGRLGGLAKGDAEALTDKALTQVGLSDLADRAIGQLSHGQRRRVGIASTLVGRDEVIVLDEPTAGLDPRTALELRGLIKTLNEERTLVLSSHDLAEVESLCTHAGILDRGHLVEVGTMDEVKGTGQRIYVRLTAAIAATDPALAALRAFDGVQGIEIEDEGATVRVEVRDASRVDGVTGEVLQRLLAGGHSVKSVERGQRLEERFMDTTGKSDEATG